MTTDKREPEYLLIPKETVEFLCGALADESGRWFGDEPQGKRNRFWWREKLRNLQPSSPAPVQGEEEAVSLDMLAKLVHIGRFPEDRAPTRFEDEDKSGREYCYRIASRVYPFVSSPLQGREDELPSFPKPPSRLVGTIAKPPVQSVPVTPYEQGSAIGKKAAEVFRDTLKASSPEEWQDKGGRASALVERVKDALRDVVTGEPLHDDAYVPLVASEVRSILSALSKARSAGPSKGERDAIWNEAVEACAARVDRQEAIYVAKKDQAWEAKSDERWERFENYRDAAEFIAAALRNEVAKHSPKAGQEDPDIERMMRGDLLATRRQDMARALDSGGRS